MKTQKNLEIINKDLFFTSQFWKKFKKDFENWLSNFSLELKEAFPQKLEHLSQHDIANYLYVPACRDYLKKYQSVYTPKTYLEKIKTLKYNLKKSSYIFVDSYSDKQEFSKTEFFKFFHRHEKLFPLHFQKDRGEFKIKKKLFLTVLDPGLQKLLDNFSLKSINLIEQIATLLINIDIFSKIKKLPSNIFTSAHWCQNSSLHQAFLTYAKSKGSSIYILQPGYFHPLAAYYDQFEFEKRIASYMITWQSGLIEKNSDTVELGFGSLYCNRKIPIREGTCVVLPQIPSFNFIRGQSKSFGLGKTLFNQSKAFSHIKKYVFDLAESSNKFIYLRTKISDLENYKKEFNKIKNKIKFDTGDINNGGYLTPFEDMRIGYFGTAIPESYFGGSSVSLVYENSNEIVFNDNFEFNNETLIKHINKTCKPAELECFNSLFSKLGI